MSSAKRDDSRLHRRWIKSELPPTERRGREHWTVRWIGAAKRRAQKRVEVETPPSTQIIQLSWAATFGRPMRIAPSRLFQVTGAVIPLPPLSRVD